MWPLLVDLSCFVDTERHSASQHSRKMPPRLRRRCRAKNPSVACDDDEAPGQVKNDYEMPNFDGELMASFLD